MTDQLVSDEFIAEVDLDELVEDALRDLPDGVPIAVTAVEVDAQAQYPPKPA